MLPDRPSRLLTAPQRFGLRFFAVLAGASVLAWVITLPARLGAVQAWLAGSAVRLARATGGQSSAAGDQIYTTGVTIDINYECTGIYVLLVFLTFLLAYPASWRSRATGAAIGTAALTAVNILRIAVLVRVSELQPAIFDYLHEYVWQGVFLVMVIAYAMHWAEHTR